MNPILTEDYRQAFQFIFEQRKLRSKLTLRGFARFLALSPSTLHALFSEKTHLSRPRLSDVVKKLKPDPYLRKHLHLLHDREFAVSIEKKKTLTEKIEANRIAQSARIAETSQYSDLVNWSALAVHEYLDVANGGQNILNIARDLSLTERSVTDAIAKLIQYGYVKESDTGRILRTSKRVLAESHIDNECLKRVHSEALDRALRALRTQNSEERYTATEFLSIDPVLIPELRRLTNEYLDRAQAIADRSSIKTALYSITLSAYRVDGARVGVTP